MNIVEPVPYRPWCEAPYQENPVDFSLKTHRASTTGLAADIRSELSVRTPDSGFSSPSESEFARKQTALPLPSHHFSSLYKSDPSLHAVEQHEPLALVKKKSTSDDSSCSPLPETGTPVSSEARNRTPPPLLSPGQLEACYHLTSQASPYNLLSSSLYWPHSSPSISNSIPFSTLVNTAYDLSISKKLLRSPQESNSQTFHPPLFPHSTPVKSHPSSPETSVLSPIKRKSPSLNVTPEKKTKSLKKTKASRRLNFDEDKTSPVSGTIIRQLEEGEEPLVIRKGDIDPAYNVVEITDEAKAELSRIENKIGDYVCRLCKELYDDAFGLAQHRCSRIIHVEYRCPECDKVFNCPANLASHRRWHKPKGNAVLTSSSHKSIRNENKSFSHEGANSGSKHVPGMTSPSGNSSSDPHELMSLSEMTSLCSEDSSEQYECTVCFKKFKKPSYLRKHLMSHSQTDLTEDEDQQSPGQISSLIGSPQHLYSPQQSPQLTAMTPLLSPPFTDSIFRCRLCSATFFTPAALQLHYSTIHDAEDQVSSNSLFSTALPIPLSPFSPKGGLLCPPYSSYPLLNRPPQISAPS